jgi:hemolysin III
MHNTAITEESDSVGERIADGCVHILGVAASVTGAAVLVIFAMGSLPTLSVLSLSIYCTGLVAVFGFSAAYHLVSWPRLKSILRRFDHAAIYFKIAATYTPFALVKMGGLAGNILLVAVWIVTAFGVISKLSWPDRLTKTSYVLYLAQGWAIIFALNPFVSAVSTRTLLLLGIGGVLYTIGLGFHLWVKLRYHNAIWHALVLWASGFHYVAVADAVAFAND